MMVSCQSSFLCRLQLVSRHVIEVQEIGFKTFGTELRRGWPPADLPGNVITWFQVLVLWLHVKEIFFLGLGVTVTEVNIKKLQKQDLKNIKNVKGCRDGMPKSMQTR